MATDVQMYRVRCHLNRTQIRSVLGIAACVVVYTTLTDAGKHIVSDRDMRHDYADSMNVNPDTLEPRDTGEAYFTAGVGNREFVVAVEPPDQTTCDSLMGFLAQDQKFLQELSEMGFQSIGCVRYENGNTSWQTRRIVPKPAPAAPAVSPAPRIEPRKHAPTASDPVALA